MSEKLWVFLNSPFGLMFIGTFMLPVMVAVLKKIVGGEKILEVYQTYKGPLFDAVKFAEKQIPDDVPHTGLKRLDEAFKFVLKLQPELAKENPTVVKALISRAHAEISAEDDKARNENKENGL